MKLKSARTLPDFAALSPQAQHANIVTLTLSSLLRSKWDLEFMVWKKNEEIQVTACSLRCVCFRFVPYFTTQDNAHFSVHVALTLHDT